MTAELRLPVQVVVVVFNVESSSFGGADEQTFGVVVEFFLPGVLDHQTSAVILVLAFPELDYSVHCVVFHRDSVAAEITNF